MTTNGTKHGSVQKVLAMRDVMTPSPHAVGSNQKVSFAKQIMTEHRLRHLPVIEAGKLLGVLSLRDIQFLERTSGLDVPIEKVTDVMMPDVYVTRPAALVHDVAQVMAEQKQTCAVVMEHAHVVGIFTVTDALKRLAAELG